MKLYLGGPCPEPSPFSTMKRMFSVVVDHGSARHSFEPHCSHFGFFFLENQELVALPFIRLVDNRRVWSMRYFVHHFWGGDDEYYAPPRTGLILWVLPLM